MVFAYITSGSILTTDVIPNYCHFFIGQLCSKYMYMSTDINWRITKITITGFSDNCSVNKMKEKNHTVGIIPKSNRIIVEREAKSIPI